MKPSFSDYVFKLAVIAALGLCIYSIRSQPAPQLDLENAIDLIIDSGYNLPESNLVLELLDSRKILVTTGINAQSSRMIMEKLHILAARDASAPIDLYLRTEGGWEADAFSIIDTIRALEAPVNIHAMGEVHSAGLMILAAGTGQRIVYPNTLLGFHATHEDEGELWKARYSKFWGNYEKLPQEWIADEDGDMHYFTAQDALDYEVADQIVSPVKHTHEN